MSYERIQNIPVERLEVEDSVSEIIKGEIEHLQREIEKMDEEIKEETIKLREAHERYRIAEQIQVPRKHIKQERDSIENSLREMITIRENLKSGLMRIETTEGDLRSSMFGGKISDSQPI